MVVVWAKVPPRSQICEPDLATDSALVSVLYGAASVPTLLSSPVGATKMPVVGAGPASRSTSGWDWTVSGRGAGRSGTVSRRDDMSLVASLVDVASAGGRASGSPPPLPPDGVVLVAPPAKDTPPLFWTPVLPVAPPVAWVPPVAGVPPAPPVADVFPPAPPDPSHAPEPRLAPLPPAGEPPVAPRLAEMPPEPPLDWLPPPPDVPPDVPPEVMLPPEPRAPPETCDWSLVASR